MCKPTTSIYSNLGPPTNPLLLLLVTEDEICWASLVLWSLQLVLIIQRHTLVGSRFFSVQMEIQQHMSTTLHILVDPQNVVNNV